MAHCPAIGTSGIHSVTSGVATYTYSSGASSRSRTAVSNSFSKVREGWGDAEQAQADHAEK
eukprot:scaffold2740_cov418-Prasinococcus_capsulatus_cf.AAC.30